MPERLNTCNETHSSLGQAICAAPVHPRTISLYSSCVHNNVAELIYESTHRTLWMSQLSDVGVGRPGSVPFVSHRPGAYGRLLLAVYVRWKTGLLVTSDWLRPVTRGGGGGWLDGGPTSHRTLCG